MAAGEGWPGVHRAAQRRGGVVTIRDARRSGIPDATWYGRARRDQLTDMGAGALLLPGCVPTEFARRHAALEVLGPDAALSHDTALELLGLRDQSSHDVRTHVVVPYEISARPPRGVRRHRSRDLTAADRTLVGGLAVTSAARTIVDMAGNLSTWRLEALFLAARQRGLLDVPDVDHQLGRRRGLRGLASARKAAQVLAAGNADSILEHRCRQLLRAAGLEVSEGPRSVVARGQRLAIDMVVVGSRVAIECDGRAFHTDADAFERDRERWRLLRETGWRTVWVTWKRLHERPHSVVEEVRREIARSD